MGGTAVATFCATLVDEWVRAGVAHAFVAPGSRSTPLALALATRPELHLHVFHDERSAAFAALGAGLATGRPAIVLCTSGTAAAHFHAAVVEADQDGVPLVVVTADRPPELRDVAAPQTISQHGLYGRAPRWFHDPGPPDDSQRATWRSLAARAVADATIPAPGPVHLNLPFRDPLVGEPGELPPGRAGGLPWHVATAGLTLVDGAELDLIAVLLEHPRGVVVAGKGAGDPGAVHGLAAAVGWPVLAEPRSGARLALPTTVAAFDALLRHRSFADDHRPEVVLRLGRPPASKVLAQWLAGSGATQVQVSADPGWVDPDHTAACRVVADPGALCASLTGRVQGAVRTPWLSRWRAAEAKAQAALATHLDRASELDEPGVARRVVAGLPDGALLVVSSSMPVRDVEWYGAPRAGLRVLANRGANGIDGVVSTAVGAALGSRMPTGLLVGDVAFLHDSNGLITLAEREADLRVVVVDNDGGGIFSFLPQASALPPERFEQLFGTPHGVDLVALCASLGLAAERVTTPAGLDAALATPGPRVCVVATDRRANVAAHDALHAAVAQALDGDRPV